MCDETMDRASPSDRTPPADVKWCGNCKYGDKPPVAVPCRYCVGFDRWEMEVEPDEKELPD